MNASTGYTAFPIGWVHSPLTRAAESPKQAYEGAPNAVVQIEPVFQQGRPSSTSRRRCHEPADGDGNRSGH